MSISGIGPFGLGGLFGISLVTLSAPLLAASPFDGRWRADMSVVHSNARPRTILLKDGTFKDDDNSIVIPADGSLHSVRGGGYVDQTSIAIVDDHHVREVDRIRGKIVYTVSYAISADGKFLDLSVTSFANPQEQPVYSGTRYRRIGSAPTRAHIISGDWQQVRVSVNPASDWILRLKGHRFSNWTLQGVGYAAIVGGSRVRIIGDQSGGFAAITMPTSNTVIEADSSPDGKVGGILTMTLLPDRKTIRAVALAPQTGKTSAFLLRKQ